MNGFLQPIERFNAFRNSEWYICWDKAMANARQSATVRTSAREQENQANGPNVNCSIVELNSLSRKGHGLKDGRMWIVPQLNKFIYLITELNSLLGTTVSERPMNVPLSINYGTTFIETWPWCERTKGTKWIASLYHCLTKQEVNKHW